ncbi:MAG: hypothetical protein LBC71_03185, partial [Oscillospiraceae bacterium]|nr:hypothetical protein [Oscillospiraceae bacterium]
SRCAPWGFARRLAMSTPAPDFHRLDLRHTRHTTKKPDRIRLFQGVVCDTFGSAVVAKNEPLLFWEWVCGGCEVSLKYSYGSTYSF